MSVIISENPLFKQEKEAFPIEVDYGKNLREEWRVIINTGLSFSDIELNGRKFFFASGQMNFVCYYATLLRESHLWGMWEDFQEAKILPADMR